MVVLIAGCGVVSTKERLARDLYLRIAQGDCIAYQELVSRREAGERPAAAYLGLALQQGLAKPCRSDAQLALMAYAPAIEHVPQADFNVGLLLLQLGRPEEAEQALLRAAGGERRDGERRAMVKLAQIYDAALVGLPHSAALASQWYEAAAKLGDLHAQTRFALRLISGTGVQPDPQRGIGLLEHAAHKGSRDARYALYDLSRKGSINGRPKPEVAAKWLGAAALADPTLALEYRAFLSRLPLDTQASVAHAVSMFAQGVGFAWNDDDYDAPLLPPALLASMQSR